MALSLTRSGQFADQWDSRQIGYVLVKKHAGFRNILKAAESLVSEWNSYLSGEVYGYVIEGAEDSEDSCWGFIGDIKYCIAEAKSAAEGCRKVEQRRESECSQMMCQ